MSRNISEFGFKGVRKQMYGVTIYNPDKELKDKLIEQFTADLVKTIKSETGEIDFEINDRELVLAYLPQLTDIVFDLDNEVDIINIIENPSIELEEILMEVKEILLNILKSTINLLRNFITTNLEMIQGMDDREKEMYFMKLVEISSSKKTEEELKIIEKAKKLGAI